MKNRIRVSLILLFFGIPAFGQIPAWVWAKKGGSTGSDIGNSIAADAGGSSFITGSFDSPSLTLGSAVLNNSGGTDFFIVKYDGAGNVLWAKKAGGTGNDAGYGITVDANGNSLVTGSFYSTSVSFDSIALTNAGGADFFIAKYDAGGNVLWAKSAGGIADDNGKSIAADINGNIFVTGYFNSTTINFGTVSLTNSGGSDIFIVKYDGSDSVIWANSAGGIGTDYGSSIAADASGNLYITGYFLSPVAVFGSTVLNNVDNSGLTEDVFTAKYNSSGSVAWAKSAGGTSNDAGVSISADANGNSYMTGSFNSPSITFGSNTLSTAGGDDVFVVKRDGSGNVDWAKSAGGSGSDAGYGIKADANGDSYITGRFKSATITFGSVNLSNTNGSGNSYDVFVVKYDASGNVPWAKGAGGTYGDSGNGISVDAGGHSLITGYFVSSSITFGGTTLTNSGSGNSDIFVAKTDNSTGIQEENIFFNPIHIFSDPVNGMIRISSVQIIDEIEIRNVSGQIAYSEKPGEKNVMLKVAYTGIYLITVKSGKEAVTKKIAIMK